MLILNESPHSIKRSLLFFLLLFIDILNLIKVELMFALGTEMIQILDDPLPNALFMEDVSAGQ
jgi:hypothetical protein